MLSWENAKEMNSREM